MAPLVGPCTAIAFAELSRHQIKRRFPNQLGRTAGSWGVKRRPSKSMAFAKSGTFWNIKTAEGWPDDSGFALWIVPSAPASTPQTRDTANRATTVPSGSLAATVGTASTALIQAGRMAALFFTRAGIRSRHGPHLCGFVATPVSSADHPVVQRGTGQPDCR